MLNELFAIIEDRKAHPVEGSYTNQLLSEGEDRIVQKVGEEAIEVIVAAKGQGDQRVVEETADLFYHTLVLLASRGLRLADVEAELRRRHGKTGATSQ
jgi:phosphoribosyl-ATP pyrophosphohydrolase